MKEELVKVVDMDEEEFEERYELMKNKVIQLIDDWKERDYPKGRRLEVAVATRKDNHNDVWRESYNFLDKTMVVFFIAEIGTKREDE